MSPSFYATSCGQIIFLKTGTYRAADSKQLFPKPCRHPLPTPTAVLTGSLILSRGVETLQPELRALLALNSDL